MMKLKKVISENALKGLFLCKDLLRKFKEEEGALTLEYIIVIIIAIVIGGVVLAYFKDTLPNDILPSVTTKIKELFN